jgi:predicted Rossmann fold flavoprotein
VGGHNKSDAYHYIEKLGHTIIKPIPSLFTINLPGESIKKELQGLSIQNGKVSIKGTKYFYSGPVLITHWGLSGPAVLKLSAYAAKHFYDKEYNDEILVNWTGNLKTHEAELHLLSLKKSNQKQTIGNSITFDLPKRLWHYLIHKSGIPEDLSWPNVSNKQIQVLSNILTNDTYHMEGKTTFKEEFVTAGGVDLKEVNFKTMESKLVEGVYFCGEVLNVDGITGGFNFQAAWSTAYVAATSIK